MRILLTTFSLALLAATFIPVSLMAQERPRIEDVREEPQQQTAEDVRQSIERAAAEQRAENSYTFTPLTNLPGINQAASSDTLPSFFSSLYKLCIGAAAVIAVLQIMRAGAYFMFNKGSVAHNEQGKSLIMNSILGLLLVLSPAIVFGIINPDILNLRLDFGRLSPGPLTSVDLSTGANTLQQECSLTQPVDAGERQCWDQKNAELATAYSRCISAGTATQTCRSQAETAARAAVGQCFGSSVSEAERTCIVGRSLNYAQSQSRNTGPVPEGQPDTQAVVNQEYEWRLFVTNDRGGRVSSYPGEWTSPGPGRRHPTQQACQNDLNSFMSTFTQRHRNWTTESVCTCEQPRSAFPACRN